MKKVLLAVFASMFVGTVFSQNFKGHASGTYGILNSKIRIQYELPLGSRFTAGANLNYYLINWKGALIEPFVRIYASDGNDAGGFFQVKAGYGNLTNLPELTLESKRWSTYGGGVAWGYKYVRPSGFTIEPIVGLRIYSAPKEFDSLDTYQDAADLGENIGWAVTTGLPLDFQLKFGYQF